MAGSLSVATTAVLLVEVAVVDSSEVDRPAVYVEDLLSIFFWGGG
jgi:hypothetical protein